MTTRLGSVNSFCWMDLKAHDVAGVAEFFSAALGWRFAVDEGDWRRAVRISSGGHQIGGVSDLANPVYPPGIPAHIAYYLAVDDVERRVDAATANGARLVVAPFDAGDQGRTATLVDPFGAAFSPWQAREFGGWQCPPGAPFAPHRMVHISDQPNQARLFYRELLGVDLAFADFVPPPEPESCAPRWELVVSATDVDGVAARAAAHGLGHVAWLERVGRRVLRLTGPEGLSFRVVPVDPRA
ncbi:VOC family protein [Streptoalloteichus hindustanus]|uniref:VOC domain-containing protein n=1 Tax=Streptoalloteichus hindustanus TaxID=2017 RepID=A0A1M4YKK5_STRHI|nr:VOC family protein [Streptoalloteichus hindustanus]SHF05926.1 hypothetical protein SAMN05444320_102383 [Streptoalloteichus hindustanus]